MAIEMVVLDVDGVIVGSKSNIPTAYVLRCLKKTSKNGLLIVLNTSKPIFADGLSYIVNKCGLSNLHITFSGSLISDIEGKEPILEKVIDKRVASRLTGLLLKLGFYFEIHTKGDFYIDAKFARQKNLARIRRDIIGRDCKVSADIKNESGNALKIFVIVWSQRDKKKLVAELKKISGGFNFGWSQHPKIKGAFLCPITAENISKKQAVKRVAKHYKIPLVKILGIGDSEIDWDFLEICGYACAVSSGDKKLSTLVGTKAPGHFYISKSVEKDGLVNAFEYFGITNR